MKIDKKEVLRYLGYKGQILDEKTENLIDQSIKDIQNRAEIRSIHRIFPLAAEGKRLLIEGTDIHLAGEDIRRYLKNSSHCIIIAATLGHEVDRFIRYYERLDMTKALILDAAASVTIEGIIDKLNQDLKHQVALDHKALTSRYSPGYGDFPLNIQSSILDILGAKKTIGLTTNLHNILIPRKSITAVLGIVEGGIEIDKNSCDNCNIRDNCSFSKGGKGCGY